LFDQVVTATPHILNNGENAIVVTIPQRAPAIPNVPSAVEAGLPQLHTLAWSALFMPKGTPAPIVARINGAVVNAMSKPEIQKRFVEIGADIPAPDERSPAALRQLVNSEVDKWVPLIKEAGVVGE
jgi:tripartite-type tricarboxylate transporter receptor subunit TctC